MIMTTNKISEALLAAKTQRLRLLLNYWDTVKRIYEGNRTADDPDFTLENVLDGDLPHLEKDVDTEIKNFFVFILELLECGLAQNPDLYAQLRSKILRGGNDAIRNISNILKNYHVLKVTDSKTYVIKQKISIGGKEND